MTYMALLTHRAIRFRTNCETLARIGTFQDRDIIVDDREPRNELLEEFSKFLLEN